MDPYHFKADPDRNFQVDADPDTDPDVDPTPKFTHVGKSEYLFYF